MYEFFASPPWYLPVVIAFAAIACLAQGNARMSKKTKRMGLALSAVAGLLVLTAYVLESGREQAIRLTREIAAAVDERDWATFDARLDPKVRFAPIYNGKAELSAGAKKSAEAVDVKNISLSGIDVQAEPGGYTVTFLATADITTGSGRRVPTNWKFYFADSNSDDKNDSNSASKNTMLLYRIDVLPGQLLGSEPVIQRLVRP
jgi:hypothetical protein